MYVLKLWGGHPSLDSWKVFWKVFSRAGWSGKLEINGGSLKWMVYNGKFHFNRWFRGTPISGSFHFWLMCSTRTCSCYTPLQSSRLENTAKIEKRCSFFPFFQWTMLRKMRKMRQIHIPATSIAQWEAMVSRWRPSWNGTWPATPPASQMLRIWEQPWIPTAPMRASVILWRKNKVGRGCWMLLGWGGRWETTWFHSVPYFWPKKRSRKTQIPTIYPPTINHHLSTIFQPSTIINHQPSTRVPC